MKNVCRDVVSCLSYLSWERGGQGVSDVKVEIKGKVIKLKLKMMIFFSQLNHILHNLAKSPF